MFLSRRINREINLTAFIFSKKLDVSEQADKSEDNFDNFYKVH